MNSAAAEAWGYALLLTRRLLTTALAGADEDMLHQPTPHGSLADCARQACADEAALLWPRALPPARLDPPQTRVELLYALVRHRAVTEELLMQATDAALQQPHPTRASDLAQDIPPTLQQALAELAARELHLAQQATTIRQHHEPAHNPQPDLPERTARAVAAAQLHLATSSPRS